jgi:hypothetical protein
VTDERLDPDALAKLGGAFAAGYESKAAKLHFVEGVSFSLAQDLSLALGWPFLLELDEPFSPGDPVQETLSRLSSAVPPRRWPVDLATRAVRLLAFGYVKFPGEAKPEAIAAASRAEPFAAGEAKELIATMFARPLPGWRHAPWFLNALEALGGGGPVVDAVLDALESGNDNWRGVKPMPSSLVSRIAHLVRRLPEAEAQPRRERAKKLLQAALEKVPRLLDDDKLRLVPSRRLVMVVDEPELIRQGGAKMDGVLSLYDAAFLDRESFLDVLRKKGKPTEGAEASAQYVVAGGPDVLDIELERWPAYGTNMDKAAAHAYVLEQYGAFRLPGTVALIADMAAKSAVKAEALAWLAQNAVYAQPILADLAKSASPAKASAEKALKELAKRKPS